MRIALAVMSLFVAGSALAAPAAAGPPVVPGGGGTPSAGQVTNGPAPRALSAATAPPAGYPVTGIDVSSYQPDVDWSAVAAAGASFAYVKATEGTTYTNPEHTSQYTGALAAGLYAGSYAFARPDANDPVQQADYLLAQSGPVTPGRTLPFMLDLEWPYKSSGVTDACWGLSPTAMVSWIRAFVNEVRARTGSPMLIYTNPYWWNPCTNYSTAFGDQLLDVAYWDAGVPTVLPSGWTDWTFWQYADAGDLPGDQDVFGGTLADLADITLPRFFDVPRTSPFYGDVSWLVDSGITTGYADGGFHPVAAVERQAMAAFLYRSAHGGVDAPACASAPFPDVPVSNPFCGAISWLAQSGITHGNSDGGFHPAEAVSRQAMAAFLYRSAHGGASAPACASAPFNDVSRENPFCGAISWLVQSGITHGYPDGGFHPVAAVERQAMAAFLHRLAT